MARWKWIVVRSVVFPLVVLGCAAPPSPQAGDAGAPAPHQTAAFKRVSVAIRSAPSAMSQRHSGAAAVAGLDALEELVHTGLTHVDPPGARHAKLVEAVPTLENGLWKLLPEGRMETTWQLRQNARWHDGVPVTSDDLLFTTTVEQDREVGIPRNAAYDLIERIEAPDARTIVVTWRQLYVEADALFSHDVALPMPRHLLEAAFTENKSTFFAAPFWNVEYVGAGPFKVREWVADSHVVLQANDAYVLGRLKIDEIEVRFIFDPQAMVANLLAGTVEVTIGRGPSFEQALQVLDQWRDGGVVWRAGGWVVITPQFLNPTPAVVGDVRFRRALIHAIDRQEMAATLMAGQSSVAHSFVGPDEAAHQAVQGSIAKYDYDPRRAVSTIEELGFVRGADGLFVDAAGQRLSVEIMTTVQNDTHLKAMPAAADYWKAAGVTVEQVPIPLQRIQDREYRAAFSSFILGLVSISLSPADVNRYHSANTPLPENRFIGGNSARYRNPELDSYLDRYQTTIPKDQSLQVLSQIVRHQSEQVTALGLFYYVNPTMVANRVLNVGGRGVKAQETWDAHNWDVR